MGLFDIFQKKKVDANWESAYKANPSFYTKPDGSPFCAFALTEGTETILPRAPHYAVSGKEIQEYKLMLVSTTREGILGDCDYFAAIRKLEAFALDADPNNLLIKGLSLSELEELRK